jgi:hypothetical protein
VVLVPVWDGRPGDERGEVRVSRYEMVDQGPDVYVVAGRRRTSLPAGDSRDDGLNARDRGPQDPQVIRYSVVATHPGSLTYTPGEPVPQR